MNYNYLDGARRGKNIMSNATLRAHILDNLGRCENELQYAGNIRVYELGDKIEVLSKSATIEICRGLGKPPIPYLSHGDKDMSIPNLPQCTRVQGYCNGEQSQSCVKCSALSLLIILLGCILYRQGKTIKHLFCTPLFALRSVWND
jgi:hypothetical protein